MDEAGGQQGVTPSTDFEGEVEPTRQRDGLVGQQLGEYVIEARLGEGAMGIVYRGLQPVLGRPVAIKVLKPGFDDGGELLQEARAVSAARHPNIIDVFSFGETPQGQKYFVMELLAGEALDLWLRERTLTPLEVVGILKQLLSGLAAAHAAHVVHRDLKPGNLFMARLADGSHFLKILDFGLAKRVDPFAPEKTLARMAGTPLYMSPEQIRGQATGPFTDLYAVGCIAFELLMGRPPFSAPSLMEIFQHHQTSPMPPLDSSLNPLLCELVASLMEKETARRPASAVAARQVLERVERRLLAASGTNTAHQSQGAASPSSPAAAPAPAAIRARVAAVQDEPAADSKRASQPPLRRRPADARRSVKEEPDVRPTVSAPRETAADAPRPTVPLRASPGRLDDDDEAAAAPTSNEMQPLVRGPSGKAWWALLGLATLAVAAFILLPGLLGRSVDPEGALPAAPVPLPVEAPSPVEPIKATGGDDVGRMIAAPVPTPAAPATEPPPAIRPVLSAPPRVTHKTGASVESRLAALEERCLLELTDSRQRMALEDLRALRAELSGVSPEDGQRQLKDFETQWLKGAHR